VYWLTLALVSIGLLWGLLRIKRIWKQRFARRHEFDAKHLALLMAQRAEIEAAERAAQPAVIRQRRTLSLPSVSPSLLPIHLSHKTTKTNNGAARPKPPILDAVGQAIYQDLARDASQYPILCKLDIAMLLNPPGPATPRVHADFVICKKDFSPAVVILIDRKTSNPELDKAQTLLRQHRLRVLRWRADALPTPAEMHQQIFKPKA
jgi:hypothetical protein